MITFNKAPGQRILELGCGANRNSNSDCAVDVRPGPGVDFAVNLSQPDWPIGSNEFDAVLSIFCLEHIPYPAVPTFLAECLRVLKPGGRAVIIIPNTEAQLKWILTHPNGWDGKGLFESASCKLFGDQEHGKRLGAEDAGVDSHKSYFNPNIAIELFNAAGFEGVLVAPFGERATDMSIEAVKPVTVPAQVVVDTEPNQLVPTTKEIGGYSQERWEEMNQDINPSKLPHTEAVALVQPTMPYEPAKLYNRQYFDYGGSGYPMGYQDFPYHEIIARHVLARKPQSVLELGCGRGYVAKRIADAGIPVAGIDISAHCLLTRVCSEVMRCDAVQDWGSYAGPSADLCLSVAFFEHVPEDRLPHVFTEMTRVCQRGLHGISFTGNGHDKTQATLKSRAWWVERMPAGHEVIDVNELRQGKLPPEYFRSSGDQVKLNLGSYTTMAHHGWFNLDVHDLAKFAQANGFNYQQRDVRQGLIQMTGTVDAIFAHHVLEHFDYKEGLSLLRECRRVLRPETGAMRLVTPNADFLTGCYARSVDDNYPSLSDFDEMNGGCAEAKTPAAKLHALLQGGDHKAFYDAETLVGMLEEAGFEARPTTFRGTASGNARFEIILKECLEMSYGGTSLFVDAIPKVG